MLIFCFAFSPHLGLPFFTKVPPSLVTTKQLSTIRQTCQAEGLPPPKISWKRLGKPLPVAKTEVKGGNLTIRNLSPTDGGLYECVASNSMGTKNSTMKLVVEQVPTGVCTKFTVLRRTFACIGHV